MSVDIPPQVQDSACALVKPHWDQEEQVKKSESAIQALNAFMYTYICTCTAAHTDIYISRK